VDINEGKPSTIDLDHNSPESDLYARFMKRHIPMICAISQTTLTG